MGTTRSFLLLKNRGFIREELEQSLPRHMAREEAGAQEARRRMGQALGLDKDGLALLDMLEMFTQSHGVIAFREDARWLPYFITGLCDGHIVSSEELEGTSEQFRTPVLAFALFDSDDLFVSYCDAAEQTFYDYAKPAFPEFKEYDTEVYQEGLPMFLLSLDGGDNIQRMEDIQRLKNIWDEKNEDLDADDRMHNLLKFLDMQVIYDENDIPEGFVPIGS